MPVSKSLIFFPPDPFLFLGLLCIPRELTPVGFLRLRPVAGTVQRAGGQKAGQASQDRPPPSLSTTSSSQSAAAPHLWLWLEQEPSAAVPVCAYLPWPLAFSNFAFCCWWWWWSLWPNGYLLWLISELL